MKDYSNILDWTDKEIFSEIQSILYLYKLKQTTRWNTPRNEKYKTESVAEHVYGMMTLARYFLRLEKGIDNLDNAKVLDLIIWHDADEIVHGDTPTYLKTEKIAQEGLDSLQEVFTNTPDLIRTYVTELVMEYEDQHTPESHFVKALDKVEPIFELADLEGLGKRRLLDHQKLTEKDFNLVTKSISSATKDYPIISRFYSVLYNRMKEEGCYYLKENE